MTPNFVVKKNDVEILTADRLDWISYVGNSNSGMKINTAPNVGYHMVTDIKTPSIESLDLANLSSETVKTTWTFRTEAITNIIENTKGYVRFEVGEDTYEVHIRVNNTPKPKTAPVTAG